MQRLEQITLKRLSYEVDMGGITYRMRLLQAVTAECFMNPAPSNKPQKPQARDTCKQGYVWREARTGDHVCVDPRTRDDVARQNREAARLWVKGDYGPRTCRQGYVWREAFQGDQVCVVPEIRDRTQQDNARAAQRRVGG